MIKLGKRGIRLFVIPIIEDLFWSSFTIEESLKAYVSSSEIILEMSVTEEGKSRRTNLLKYLCKLCFDN